MRAKMMRAVVRLAGIAAIAALVNVGVGCCGRLHRNPQPRRPRAASRGQMTPDGYRHATLLGGPRSLIGPLKDLKHLKRVMARPAVRKNVEGAIDAAGLSAAVKDQVARTSSWPPTRRR